MNKQMIMLGVLFGLPIILCTITIMNASYVFMYNSIRLFTNRYKAQNRWSYIKENVFCVIDIYAIYKMMLDVIAIYLEYGGEFCELF